MIVNIILRNSKLILKILYRIITLLNREIYGLLNYGCKLKPFKCAIALRVYLKLSFLYFYACE